MQFFLNKKTYIACTTSSKCIEGCETFSWINKGKGFCQKQQPFWGEHSMWKSWWCPSPGNQKSPWERATETLPIFWGAHREDFLQLNVYSSCLFWVLTFLLKLLPKCDLKSLLWWWFGVSDPHEKRGRRDSGILSDLDKCIFLFISKDNL